MNEAILRKDSDGSRRVSHRLQKRRRPFLGFTDRIKMRPLVRLSPTRAKSPPDGCRPFLESCLMATSTPPTDPDSLAVLHVLARDDLSPENTYNARDGISHMAGHAVITLLEAHKAEFSAKIDALRWGIGIGFVVLGLLMTLLRLLA